MKSFTALGRCGYSSEPAPVCPAGYTDTGKTTRPGSCLIGNTPGEGPSDRWRYLGHQRVCVKSVPENASALAKVQTGYPVPVPLPRSSGNFAVDCCSGALGVAQSLECKRAGFTPYTDKCNNVMQQTCTTSVHRDPFSPEAIMETGTIGVPHTTTTKRLGASVAQHCNVYLERAPANSFYHNHNYRDYARHFPQQNYTMPAFKGGWGYTPERTPYHPWHEYQWRDSSHRCAESPQSCWNTRSTGSAGTVKKCET